MCSSPRSPSSRDSAAWGATAAAWIWVLALGGGLAGPPRRGGPPPGGAPPPPGGGGGRPGGGGGGGGGARCAQEPPPGAVEIFPEMQVRIAPAPMPTIPAPPPEPEPVVIPEPMPEPPSEPEPAPVAPPPEPVREPEPPPPVEAAPAEAAQPEEEPEGDAGAGEALRDEWLGELRRRIEQSKFYPGAARYTRETGTVLLRVEIGPTAEIGAVQILENTGSALLAEGARSILRRAAATPLGTNALASGFQVDVPITYRLERR